MQPSFAVMPFSQRLRTLCVPIFILATYFGTVTVGITLPLAVLLLPLIAVYNPSIRVPLAAVLLIGLAGVIVAQPLLGIPTVPRTDWVIFLPVLYACLTVIVISGVQRRPDDEWLLNALALGGLVVVVLGVMHLLTGEVDLARRYADDPRPWTYYDFKSMAATPLGKSNFLAAFLVFVVNVALYGSKPLIAVAASLAVGATLSRFGYLFLVATWTVWLLYQRFGGRVQEVILGCGFVTVAFFVTIAAGGLIPQVDPALSERSQLWIEGAAAFLSSPVVGQTRSAIMAGMDVAITWNPHNSVLHLMAFTGVLGTAFYFSYLWVGMRALRRQADQSDIWRGIYAGMAMFLIWGLVEIISITPAFDILFATMVGLALNESD